MVSDRISKASSKPSNIASFEIWLYHYLWCRFGCCKFYGSSEIDGLCNICRDYELPWKLPARPEPYIKQTNNLLTKTYWHCLNVFATFIVSSDPKWRLKLPYRWGIVGYLNQGHPQGSDITYIQHGYPKARGQLWFPCNWSERLRLWFS